MWLIEIPTLDNSSLQLQLKIRDNPRPFCPAPKFTSHPPVLKFSATKSRLVHGCAGCWSSETKGDTNTSAVECEVAIINREFALYMTPRVLGTSVSQRRRRLRQTHRLMIILCFPVSCHPVFRYEEAESSPASSHVLMPRVEASFTEDFSSSFW